MRVVTDKGRDARSFPPFVSFLLSLMSCEFKKRATLLILRLKNLFPVIENQAIDERAFHTKPAARLGA